MNINKVFASVFMWMFVGLLVTFATGYIVVNNENMLFNIFTTGLFYVLIIAEIGAVIFLSARINKMSYMTSIISFLLYAILNGLTLSIVFAAYELGSVIYVFGITAIVFLIFALFGYFTKLDLTKWRNTLFMCIIAIMIARIINIFVPSETFDFTIVAIGLIVFMGYTAYDIHRIKNKMYMIEDDEKLAIFGALQLYLDFINIFIRLLRLLGNRKD